MAYFPGTLVSINGLPSAAAPVPSAAAEGVQSVDLNGDKAQLLHFDKARGKLGGGFIFFNFRPYLGRFPILTHIFQMGWAKLGLRVSTHSKKESDFLNTCRIFSGTPRFMKHKR